MLRNHLGIKAEKYITMSSKIAEKMIMGKMGEVMKK